jgi:hypothetical protein
MKWEYKTIKLSGGEVDQLDRTMNELGAQGWELAAAFDVGGSSVVVVAIFKRPKE